MSLITFDWDDGNLTKCQKHGVSILEIELAFIEDVSIHEDKKHSDIEARYIIINKTESGRYIFISFTFRFIAKKLIIRPISARYMHKKEILRYEKTNS